MTDRIPPDMYARLRAWMLANDPDTKEIVDWAENIGPPKTAEDLAGEIVWIVLCAGRSAQAARTIAARVHAAIDAGRPVVEAFGYRKKAAAIEDSWRRRDELLAAYREVAARGSLDDLVAWCQSIPYVGATTKWQLAKNLGADVVKPDIWLCRCAGVPEKGPEPIRFKACMDLCRPLATASGDRIATVDSVIWLACNKGVLIPYEKTVMMIGKRITARSIYETAGDAP